MTEHDLNAFFARHIPLTRAMDLRLERWDAEGLMLAAPLAPNINDKGTAFAGALASIITLSGWSLTHLTLLDRGIRANVVIADSRMEYLRPVQETLRAWCPRPAPEVCQDFLARYQAKRKAAWQLEALIRSGDEEAVRFSGRYVAVAAK